MKIESVPNNVIKTESGCWIWLGALSTGGYGRVSIDGIVQQAHRVSYELFVGEIPNGHELHHTCNERSCINPQHLQPLTHKQHARVVTDAITHCRWGHEYTPENTYIKASNGKRECNTCRRLRQRKDWP